VAAFSAGLAAFGLRLAAARRRESLAAATKGMVTAAATSGAVNAPAPQDPRAISEGNEGSITATAGLGSRLLSGFIGHDLSDSQADSAGSIPSPAP
jgi:hypothetical protein